MSFTRVHTQLWMSQPTDVRDEIAREFDLKRTGIREVRDQDVVSDGFKQEDLNEITEERMEKYVGSKETFPRLWELTIAKAKSVINPPMHFVGVPVQAPSDESIISITQKPHATKQKKGKQE